MVRLKERYWRWIIEDRRAVVVVVDGGGGGGAEEARHEPRGHFRGEIFGDEREATDEDDREQSNGSEGGV